jgi:hypothetical protein
LTGSKEQKQKAQVATIDVGEEGVATPGMGVAVVPGRVVGETDEKNPGSTVTKEQKKTQAASNPGGMWFQHSYVA